MRNALVRTLSGVCFLGVMLCGLLMNAYSFAILFILIMTGMMWEFYRMTIGEHYRLQQYFAIATGVFFFCLAFLIVTKGMGIRYFCLGILPVTLTMISSLYVKDKSHFDLLSHLYAGLLYLALPLTLANFVVIREGSYSGMLMLSFFIIIWASDVGAYSFGMLLGKNGKKLFPSISPKKSWAGFWGGLFTAILAAAVLQLCGMLTFPLVHCLALAAIMNVAGVYGDLYESQWKRVYGRKDSGNIIPGHGGLMDRFDSAIFAIPIGVIYLLLFSLL